MCDQTVRNWLKEEKAKGEPSLTPEQEKTWLQWVEEEQAWTVDD